MNRKLKLVVLSVFIAFSLVSYAFNIFFVVSSFDNKANALFYRQYDAVLPEYFYPVHEKRM